MERDHGCNAPWCSCPGRGAALLERCTAEPGHEGEVTASDVPARKLKGIVAGSVNLALALVLGAKWPSFLHVAGSMIVGLFAYGISLVLFVVGLRHLGTARTGAYYSIAPFFGAVLSILLLHERLSIQLVAAGAFMALGLWLHLTEKHVHSHIHPTVDHEHEHSHDEHAHTLADKSAKQLSWAGTALGLTLHSLLDGLALAAAVQAGAQGSAKLAGLGVALVVILHKPFDAMAVSTLMSVSGSSRYSRHVLNGLFALASPIGAALFYFGANRLVGGDVPILGYALAFCAGSFLCIASADLLPELQFHSHDRLILSLALMAGITVAIVIGLFE